MSDIHIAFKASRAWILEAYLHLIFILYILLGIKLYDISLEKYALLGKGAAYLCLFIMWIRVWLYCCVVIKTRELGSSSIPVAAAPEI